MRSNFTLIIGLCFLTTVGATYFYVGRPYLRETETAKLICETPLLSFLQTTNDIVRRTKSNGADRSYATLVAESKKLNETLVELTQLVESKAKEQNFEGRYLREVAHLKESEKAAFIEGTVKMALHRCPAQAHDPGQINQALQSILIILKRVK